MGGKSSRMDLDQIRTSVSEEMRHSLAQMAWYAPILEEMSAGMKKKIKSIIQASFPRTYSKWVYWNESSHNVNDWQERYWGGLENYARLIQLKQKYGL